MTTPFGSTDFNAGGMQIKRRANKLYRSGDTPGSRNAADTPIFADASIRLAKVARGQPALSLMRCPSSRNGRHCRDDDIMIAAAR
jgi:hypothetical protein